MGSDHGSSRRNFLKILGQSTAIPLMQGPAQILIEAIVNGAVQKAAAAEVGASPRKLLHILHQGAPPRWSYDLFLTPYSTTGFVPNKTVVTKFTSGGKSAAYATVNKKGINVPHIWQFDVAKAGGGTRPMEDLLSNMLCLRGINVANPAHGGAQASQSLPVGATQSLAALAGDGSNDPIPAVNSGQQFFKYQSLAAKSAVSVVPSGNMLSSLLNPFMRKSLGDFDVKRDSLSAALDASVLAINASAESLNKNSKVVNNSLNSAKELLSEGFGNLDVIWAELYAKYTDLIKRSLDATVSYAGINDSEVLSDGSGLYQNNDTKLESGFDLRKMITAVSSSDGMAQRFAMAEYVLTEGLSGSVSMITSPIDGILINDDPRSRMRFDEHQTGAMVSLMLNFYFNMAYSACLLELTDRLKAKSIFNETVIVTGSEFGRNPSADGFGSGHGYSGGSSVILSGALQSSPMVLGNIYSERLQDRDDVGTWGFGAPVAEIGKPLSMGNWVATISSLLRVPSPVSAANISLMVEQAGVYKPTIELAKQVG